MSSYFDSMKFASANQERIFQRQKARVIISMLVISTLVIFSLETLLMLGLEFLFQLPRLLELLLDGFFLVVILFPLNYYFVVRPMLSRIETHYRTNLELSKSHEVVERFFSINDVLIAYMDSNFNFIRVNSVYADADGHEPAYYIGKNHFDLFPSEENLEIFTNVVRTGRSYYVIDKPFEYVGHPERGVTYWDWNLLPIRNPDGKVIELLLVLNNVTSRKMAQLARAESDRRFRAVFNQTFQHIGILDPAGNVIMINQTALEYTGLSEQEVQGLPLWEMPWWEGLVELLDPVPAAIKQAALGDIVHIERALFSASSSKAIMDITLKPMFDEDGKTQFLIYEARDITKHIQAEEALRKSEDEIHRLYQVEMRAHLLAETLHNTVVALSGSLNTETVLQTLLDHVFSVVPYTSAHINLLEDEDHMVVRVARGEEKWDGTERILEKRFEASELPFYQSIVKDKKTISIPDTMLYPGLSFLPVDRFVRSWLGVPIEVGEQVIGVCIFEHVCPGFFTDDLVRWATALTSQAGVAIQNAWLFEQVQEGREHMQALTRRLVETQESERIYIARELHDEAGQALASLMFGLRMLERENGEHPDVIARCQELRQIADEVLENLHRLAVNLRPASLDHLGLVAALRQQAEMVSDQHGLAIQFEAVDLTERMPGEVETAVYRIVQEALTNVVRHAHATRADILLERRENSLVVVVEDNGEGFDPYLPKEGHLGLLGMKERAEMLGGTLAIESAPGQGSTIYLEVPCPSES